MNKDHFLKDCRILLDAFEERKTFYFNKFSEVWVKQKFSLIFFAIPVGNAYTEFMDMCFYIVKDLFLHPNNEYGRVGAFYMLYAIYFKQPYNGVGTIPLNKDDYSKILEFIQVYRDATIPDPIFAFAKLRVSGAFNFTTAGRLSAKVHPAILRAQRISELKTVYRNKTERVYNKIKIIDKKYEQLLEKCQLKGIKSVRNK